MILPHATLSASTGVKSTSMGKSSKTGPGAPELATLHARLTIRGISPTLVTSMVISTVVCFGQGYPLRCANLVIGFASTTWSWKPWSAFVSASLKGGELVMQRTGERSAKAVASPGSPLQNLEGVISLFLSTAMPEMETRRTHCLQSQNRLQSSRLLWHILRQPVQKRSHVACQSIRFPGRGIP